MAGEGRPSWWFDPEERDVEMEGLGLTRRFVRPSRLTDSQERRMLKLLEVAFNGGPAWFELPVPHLDHWRWKVHDFPGPTRVELIERAQDGSDASALEAEADDGGRIAGMIAERWRPWLMRGKPTLVRDSVDLALDPSLQDRGVQSARRNWHHRQRDFMHSPLSLSMSAHPTARHIAQRLGYQAVGNDVSVFSMPLDPTALSAPPVDGGRTAASRTMVSLEASRRPRRAGVLRWMAWHARWLRSRASYEFGRARRGHPWSIETSPAFDERVDQLLADFSAEFDLIYLRDRDYLNWRYADPRGGPFTIRVAEAGGQLLGYAVTRVWRGRSELADIVAPPGRLDVAASLIDDAVGLVREARSPLLRAWLPRLHPYAAILRRRGFREDATPGRLVYGGDEAINEYSFLASSSVRVHYVLGDTDAI